jgi:hypothetical protein
MKKLVAIVALGALLVGLVAPPAHAHGGAVLALAAFTAFNLLFLPFALAAAVLTPPVYAPPAVFPSPALISRPVAFAPAVNARVSSAPVAPAFSREVVYAHGRYVLYGDGVSRPFQWIWIPNSPPPGSAPGY